MQGIIHIGDKTTGGGMVLSSCAAIIFGGIGVARRGNPVSCPVPDHGLTESAEGHSTFRDNGVSIAFHGHLCASGCASISSLPKVVAS